MRSQARLRLRSPGPGFPSVMLRVGGRPFRCPCGCNVFTAVGHIYTCNACGERYEGAP